MTLHVAPLLQSPFDRNATGAATPLPGDRPGMSGRETHERTAALERVPSKSVAESYPLCAPEVAGLDAALLFTLISENVRDYAVFLMDRLLYGTDMGTSADMYRSTFRILETEDEHFYLENLRSYHGPYNGFGLPDEVLRKVYRENAQRILHRPRP